MMFKTVSMSIVLALAGTSAFADKTNFDKFTPMTGDVGESTLPEAAPYRLSSPDFSQTVGGGQEPVAVPATHKTTRPTKSQVIHRALTAATMTCTRSTRMGLMQAGICLRYSKRVSPAFSVPI